MLACPSIFPRFSICSSFFFLSPLSSPHMNILLSFVIEAHPLFFHTLHLSLFHISSFSIYPASVYPRVRLFPFPPIMVVTLAILRLCSSVSFSSISAYFLYSFGHRVPVRKPSPAAYLSIMTFSKLCLNTDAYWEESVSDDLLRFH